MKKNMNRRSLAAGYKYSILPEFTPFERDFMKGTVDYFGVNLYTSFLIQPYKEKANSLFWKDAMEVIYSQPSAWRATATVWLKVSLL